MSTFAENSSGWDSLNGCYILIKHYNVAWAGTPACRIR